MIYACSCLVEQFDAKYVALAHHSVKEYLHSQQTQQSFPRFYIQPDDCGIELAKICLRYVLFDDFQDGECTNETLLEARLKDFPRYRYATYNWSEHAKDVLSRDEILDQLACKLLSLIEHHISELGSMSSYSH